METIFDFIEEQKTKYSEDIKLEEGWPWNMKKHLRRSFLYFNSQFDEHNEDRELRPSKNIVLPIMNIHFRTEGFDVKDIELYVDNPDEHFKSMLIKKYHDKWVLDNGIDTFIDDLVESYCVYGGVLVRKTNKIKPEVIDLRSLAFCNQHDILSHPFAIRHEFSFSQLRREAKKRGWGGESADIDIEDLIVLVKKDEKDMVEIYEVHGFMPIEWLDDEPMIKEETEEDVNQIQVVSFYKDEGVEKGVTLFKKRMPELPFKLFKRDKIYNRALGRGGVEELFEPQIWTNWNEIKITEMLDSASKTLFFSDDPQFKARNNLNEVLNNQVLNLQEGRSVQQLDTFPRNLAAFNDSVNRFWEHAQLLGSAPEPLLGEEPSSGTPFKLYEAQQMESKSMHKHRQGQIAVFMDEIYRDWILPHLSREVCKEQVFLSELSIDEIEQVTDKVIRIKLNRMIIRQILSGQIVTPDFTDLMRQVIQEDLRKKGNKWFFKILKDEMKDITISVSTNIAGKQKNMALLTDKLVNVLRQYIATPQIRQDPEMAKLLNTILESSGLSPMTFSAMPAQPVMAQKGTTQPMQALGKGQMEQGQQAKII
jgi:hypothetical protein